MTIALFHRTKVKNLFKILFSLRLSSLILTNLLKEFRMKNATKVRQPPKDEKGSPKSSAEDVTEIPGKLTVKPSMWMK